MNGSTDGAPPPSLPLSEEGQGRMLSIEDLIPLWQLVDLYIDLKEKTILGYTHLIATFDGDHPSSIRLHAPRDSVKTIRLNGTNATFSQECIVRSKTQNSSLTEFEVDSYRDAAVDQRGNYKIDVPGAIFDRSTDGSSERHASFLHVEVEFDIDETSEGVHFYETRGSSLGSNEGLAPKVNRFCIVGAPHQPLSSTHSTTSMGSTWLPCIDRKDRMYLWEMRITPAWNDCPLSREDSVAIGSGDFVSMLSLDSWGRRGNEVASAHGRKGPYSCYVSRSQLAVPASAIGGVVGPYSTLHQGRHERAKDALHVYKGVNALSRPDSSKEDSEQLPPGGDVNFFLPHLPVRKGLGTLSIDDAEQIKVYPPPDDVFFSLPPVDTLLSLATPHENQAVNRQREHGGPLPADFKYCLRFVERFTQMPLPSKSFSAVYVPNFYAPGSFKSVSSLGLCSSSLVWGSEDCGCTEVAHMEGVSVLPSECLASAMNIETVLEQRRLQVLAALSSWFSCTGGGMVAPMDCSDEWLVKGLSGYIGWKYLKAICGESEYQYQVYSANRNVCLLEERYPSLPPLCSQGNEDNEALKGLSRPPHYEKLVSLKAPLVCHCLAGLVGEERFEKAVQQSIMRVFYSRNQLKHAILNTLNVGGYSDLTTLSPTQIDNVLSVPGKLPKNLGFPLESLGVKPSSVNEPTACSTPYQVIPSHIWSQDDFSPCFSLSTEKFLLNLAQVCGATLHSPIRNFADCWIYSRGTSFLNAGWYFRREDNRVDLSVEQVVRPGQLTFKGELPIRVVEAGEEHLHKVQVKGCRHLFGLHCQRSTRKSSERKPYKKSGAALGKVGVSGSGSSRDLVNDTPVSWIVVDPNIRWIRRIKLLLPAILWKEMLEHDKNVISQLEAINAIANMTTRTYSRESRSGEAGGESRPRKRPSGTKFYKEGITQEVQQHLLDTLLRVATKYDMTQGGHYFRVRAAAVEALAVWQNRRMPPSTIPTMKSSKIENGRIVSEDGLTKMIRLYKYLFVEGSKAKFPLQTQFKVEKNISSRKNKMKKGSAVSDGTTPTTTTQSSSRAATDNGTSDAKTGKASFSPYTEKQEKGPDQPIKSKRGRQGTGTVGKRSENVPLLEQLKDHPEERPKPITMLPRENATAGQDEVVELRALYEVQKSLLRAISRVRCSDGFTPEIVIRFLLMLAERAEWETVDVSVDSAVFYSVVVDALCRAYADSSVVRRYRKRVVSFVKGLLARETLRFQQQTRREGGNTQEYFLEETSNGELAACTEGLIASTCIRGLCAMLCRGVEEENIINFDYYLSSSFPPKVQTAAFDALLTLNLERVRIVENPPSWLVDGVHSGQKLEELAPTDADRKDQLRAWFSKCKAILLHWTSSFLTLLHWIGACTDDRIKTYYLTRLFELQKDTDGDKRFSIANVDLIDLRLKPYMSDAELYEYKRECKILSFYIGLAGLSRRAAGLAVGIEEPESVLVPASLHTILGVFSDRPSARGALFPLGEPSVIAAVKILSSIEGSEDKSEAVAVAECAEKSVEYLSALIRSQCSLTSRQRRIIFHIWHSIWGRNVPLTNVSLKEHIDSSANSEVLRLLQEQRALTAWSRRVAAQRALMEFQQEEIEYENLVYKLADFINREPDKPQHTPSTSSTPYTNGRKRGLGDVPSTTISIKRSRYQQE
eukprot:gb/GECG01016656.1/.p1 GENE.gb/GECG01016656.1/~~gb/GECG01016656.1/.p1  ORF type:complete len:1667 (+),score=178.41 gb/GECG01016656.1/:1-5001(+)